ncbi:MAG: hypothetical protein FWF86_01665, partial [Clostridia bacterium]|nr:hypothetical protein [Clostridia bacterium]
MHKNGQRMLSVILCALMALDFSPIAAFASEITYSDPVQVTKDLLAGDLQAAETSAQIAITSDISETQPTYNLLTDTRKLFQVRYSPPPAGTFSTLLVIECLAYGAQFAALPSNNPNVRSVLLVNPTTMVILLVDGLTSDIVIQQQMESIPLTTAQAIQWIDAGALPVTGFKARASTGSLNGASFTESELLASAQYGAMEPETYPAPVITPVKTYNMTVPSVGAMTNTALSFTAMNTSATSYYNFYVNTNSPAYLFSNNAANVENTPLIEYTGLKVYAPHPRLELYGVGDQGTGAYCMYPFTTDLSLKNWVVGPAQTDDAGLYYMITPPEGARCFNIMPVNVKAVTLGMRLNWRLKDTAEELPYAAASHTAFTAPRDTQLLYRIPGAEGTVSASAPVVSTFAREESEVFTVIPSWDRLKSRATSEAFAGTTHANVNFAALRNTYWIETAGSVKKELTPVYAGGPVTETYDFPYEIRPTVISFQTGYYPSDTGTAYKRDTILDSVTATLNTGGALSVPAATLNTWNSPTGVFNGFGTSASYTFPVPAGSYITQVAVTWSKISTEYFGYIYNNSSLLMPNTTVMTGAGGTGTNYWSYSYRTFNEATRFNYGVTETHQDGSPIVPGEMLQVGYRASANGNTGKNFGSQDYLWFQTEVLAKCPELVDMYGSYMYPTYATFADGKSSNAAGTLYLLANSQIGPTTMIRNPQVRVLGNNAYSTSYNLPGMTNEQVLGFLSGEFDIDRRYEGWKITYSAGKLGAALPGRQDQEILVTGGSGYQAVNLGIDNAAGEYLTKLEFSYEGDFTMPTGTTLYLMNNMKTFAWNINFITGGPLQLPTLNGEFSRFHIRFIGEADWDNCSEASHQHDRSQGRAQQARTNSSYHPGGTYYLSRLATLVVDPPAVNASTYGENFMQTIFQNGDTTPETYARFNYLVRTPTSSAYLQPTYYAFSYLNNPGAASSAGYVPWGVSEDVYVELTDGEFIVDPAHTSLFGVPVGPNLAMSIVNAAGSRFLKLTLSPGYLRNTYFKADGTVTPFSASTEYTDRLGGVLQIGFHTVPGTTLGKHNPLGRVYFDFSQLLEDYASPAAANSLDGRTVWKMDATTVNKAVADSPGLSKTGWGGNKLFAHDLSAYTVNVIMFTALSAILAPGAGGIFDSVTRAVRFNSSSRRQLEAMLSFSGSPDVDVQNFVAYVQIPKAGTAQAYRDDKGNIQTSVSQYDMVLLGLPELRSDSTNQAAGNLIFAYTTDPHPGASSVYTTIPPATEEGWAAVTGIRITAATLPRQSALNMVLPLAAQAKNGMGTQAAYIGGEFSYSLGGQAEPASLLKLGTYHYEDVPATQNPGRVFFDVYDENGLWNGNPATERLAGAGEVTVNLYDTDGTTLIYSAVTDAGGEFVLKSSKTDAGQILEVIPPAVTTGGEYMLTGQSAGSINASYIDSDFNRITRRVTLPELPENGIPNLSAGLVRLPLLTVSDISVTVGETVNLTAVLTDYLTAATLPASSYNLTFDQASDPGVASLTAKTEIFAARTAGNTTTKSAAVTGVAPGTTTVTVTTTNALGDIVSATATITVTPPAPVEFPLTVKVEEVGQRMPGVIAAPAPNQPDGSYAAVTLKDSRLTLTATPIPGFTFSHWTTASGVLLNAGQASTLFTMPENEAVVVAHFTQDPPIQLVVEAASDEVPYDGIPHTASGWQLASGALLAGHTLTGLSASVTGTAAGSYENALAGTPVILAGGADVTYMYQIALLSGALTIGKRPLTLTPDNRTEVYSGAEYGAASFTAAGLAAGHLVDGSTVVITGSRTDAGSTQLVIA